MANKKVSVSLGRDTFKMFRDFSVIVLLCTEIHMKFLAIYFVDLGLPLVFVLLTAFVNSSFYGGEIAFVIFYLDRYYYMFYF